MCPGQQLKSQILAILFNSQNLLPSDLNDVALTARDIAKAQPAE